MENSLENKKRLFRAYDVRGLFGSEIDPDLLFKIGIAVCNVIKNDLKRRIRLYVGFDVRQTSEMLAYSFVSGAVSTGAEVVFLETPNPFGVVLYSGLSEKVDFTAFITASHLPPEMNGVKFYYGDGVGFSEQKITEIRDEFVRIHDKPVESFVKWNEMLFLQKKSFFDEYAQFMKNNFSISKPLNVIIDCGNGSASISAPTVFKNCGYNTTLQWTDVDPTFPNRSSEPNVDSLKVLCQQVKEKKPDFGVAFDGDGDRAVIVDELGRVIPADEIAIVVAKYLSNFFKTTIKNPLLLANIECSSAFEKNLSQEFDIKRIKVGHTFLTLDARINKDKCLLGVESSGHYVFPQYFLFDDAMLLPMIVGKLLEQETKTLSELLSNIPKMISYRKAFKCPDDKKFDVIKILTQELKDSYPNMNNIDGLAIKLEKDGYVLIRASNTEPKIRLFAEASTQNRVDEIVKIFTSALEKCIGN